MPLPGPGELIIILVIALLILGPGKLPEVGSALGKSIREFRKASTDLTDAVKVDTSPLPPPTAQETPVAPPAPVAPASVAPAPVEPTTPPAQAPAPTTEPTTESR
jgi:sec-independent protein translocase protein TatA